MPPGRTGTVSGTYYGLEMTPEEEALLYGDAVPPPPQGGYASEPQGGNDVVYTPDSPDPSAGYAIQDPAATSQPYQAAPSLPAPESAAYLPATTPYSPTMDQRASNAGPGATDVLTDLFGPTPTQNGSTYIPASQRNNAGVDNIQQAPELHNRSVGDQVGGAANSFIGGMLNWGAQGAAAQEGAGAAPAGRSGPLIENPAREFYGSPPPRGAVPGPRASRSARDEPMLPAPTAAALPAQEESYPWYVEGLRGLSEATGLRPSDNGTIWDSAGNIVPAWVDLVTHDDSQVARAREAQDAMGQVDSSPAGREAKAAVETTIHPAVERLSSALLQGNQTTASGNTSVPRAQQGTPRSSWGLSAGDRRNQDQAIDSLLRSSQPPAPTNSTAQSSGTSPFDVFMPLLPQGGSANAKQESVTTPAPVTTPGDRSGNRSTTAGPASSSRMADPGRAGFTDVYGTRGGDPALQELKGVLQADGTLDANGNISTQGMTDFKTLGWVDSAGRWTAKANADGAVDGDKVGGPVTALNLRPKGTAKAAAVPEYDPANDPNATTPKVDNTTSGSGGSGWVDYGTSGGGGRSSWKNYGSGGGGGGGYSSGGYSGGGGGGDMAAALAFLGDDFMGGRFKDMMGGGSGGDMSWESFLEDADGNGEFSASEIKAAKKKSKMGRGSRTRRSKTLSTSSSRSAPSSNKDTHTGIRRDILERVEGMTPKTSTKGKKKSG